MFPGLFDTKTEKEEAGCYLPKMTKLSSHDLLKYLLIGHEGGGWLHHLFIYLSAGAVEWRVGAVEGWSCRMAIYLLEL